MPVGDGTSREATAPPPRLRSESGMNNAKWRAGVAELEKQVRRGEQVRWGAGWHRKKAWGG